MGKVQSVRSLKAQNLIWRILKIATYLLGFLFLYHLIHKDAGNLTGHFFASVAKIPVYYVVGAWAVVAVAQLICAFIFKKRLTKIIVVAVVGFATLAAPLVYVDFFVKSEFETLAADYEAKGLDFESYEDQLYDYPSLAADTNAKMTGFLKFYNIGYNSEVFGDENTDMSDYLYVEAGTETIDTDFFTTDYVFGLAKGDAYYSKNGLYADGYVFGYKQARYILEVYYNTQKKYEAANKDVDEELQAAIDALTDNTNSAWNRYMQSAEYKEFYGDDLTEVQNAKRYYITEDRLNDILSVLGGNLGSGKSKTSLSGLLSLLSIAGISLPGDVTSYISADLTLDQILSIAEGFGLSLTKKKAMNLLEGFSHYQSPQTKPIFYFITNPELREYAYAKYLGEVHGADVGSVLIGDPVGKVTMNDSGNPAEDIGDRLASFEQMDADAAYMPKYYPWIVLREYFLLFCGIIPLSIAAAYLFAGLEKKTLDQLIKGGNK